MTLPIGLLLLLAGALIGFVGGVGLRAVREVYDRAYERGHDDGWKEGHAIGYLAGAVAQPAAPKPEPAPERPNPAFIHPPGRA